MRALASALVAVFNPQTNPFILRNLRRELRQNRPLIAVMGTGALLTLTYAHVLWQWRKGEAPPVPACFGGSIACVAAGIVILFHVIVILHTSHARVARLLYAEAAGQTLEQLLLAPMTRVELLLSMAAHPFLYGMLMALVGLPLYALAVVMGGLDWWQVAVLYLFFACLSFVTPLTSDMQVARWRDPDTEVTASVTANRAARGARAGGWITTVVGILFGPPILLTVVAVLLFAPGAPLGGLVRFLPPALSPLSGGGMTAFTGVYLWPYWLIVALAAPMPCFGHGIPPIALFVTAWTLFRLRQFINCSADLQTPRAYAAWLAPREHALTLCERTLSSAVALMLVGYLWEQLVKTGDLGLLISNTADTPHALAGLFTLLVGLAGWRALRRGYEHFGNNGLPFTIAGGMRRAVRFLVPAIGIGILQYAICCVLGREKPFNSVVIGPALRVIVTLGGMAMALWGVVALGNALDPPEERRARAARPLLQADAGTALRLFFQRGGGRLSLDLIIFAAFWLIPFVAMYWESPGLIPFTIISPWMGPIRMMFALPHMTKAGQLLAGIPWWQMPLAQSALGGVCFLVAARRRRATARADAPMTADVATSSARRVAADSPTDRCVNAITLWLSQRWENAVFIKDLRARGRARNWAVVIPTGVATFLLIGAYALYEPAVANAFHWTWNSVLPSLENDLPGGLSKVAALACLPLISAPLWILWVLGGAIAANEGAHSIEGERAKATLQFLLVTPLTDREIVRGKLWGSMVPLLLLWARFAPVMALGTVVALAMRWLPEALMILVLGSLFAGAALLASCAMSMAVATFPWGRRGDRSGWGGMVFIVLEGLQIWFFTRNGFAAIAVLMSMTVTHAVIGFAMLSICDRFVGRLRHGEVDSGGARLSN